MYQRGSVKADPRAASREGLRERSICEGGQMGSQARIDSMHRSHLQHPTQHGSGSVSADRSVKALRDQHRLSSESTDLDPKYI